MSWLFSQALVEASSAATSLDGEPSAPLSGSPTQQAYLPPDRTTAFSRPSRSGMTFRPLTDDLGAAVLTWCLEAFRARTSALRGGVQELTDSAAACGGTWRGSLARFDPATSSWRTAQHSLLEDLGESSVIWPRSGMTANGQCWELPMLGRRISGTGSGLSVPTPTVYDSTGKGTPRKDSNLDQGGRHGVSLHHFVAKWPTPTASQARSEGMIMQLCALVDAGTLTREEAETMAQGSLTPPRMKPWPTPTVCGNYNRKGASATSGDGLATAVLKCATPTASPWRSGKASEETHARNSRPLSEQIGGSLNPTWVEALMGWPTGWTDLHPLGTKDGKTDCQESQQACKPGLTD